MAHHQEVCFHFVFFITSSCFNNVIVLESSNSSVSVISSSVHFSEHVQAHAQKVSLMGKYSDENFLKFLNFMEQQKKKTALNNYDASEIINPVASTHSSMALNGDNKSVPMLQIPLTQDSVSSKRHNDNSIENFNVSPAKKPPLPKNVDSKKSSSDQTGY
jgi:hypothetical protein